MDDSGLGYVKEITGALEDVDLEMDLEVRFLQISSPITMTYNDII